MTPSNPRFALQILLPVLLFSFFNLGGCSFPAAIQPVNKTDASSRMLEDSTLRRQALAEEIKDATPAQVLEPTTVATYQFSYDDTIHQGPLLRRTSAGGQPWSLLLGALMPTSQLDFIRINSQGTQVAIVWSRTDQRAKLLTVHSSDQPDRVWSVSEVIRDVAWLGSDTKLAFTTERNGRAGALWGLNLQESSPQIIHEIPAGRGQLLFSRTGDPQRVVISTDFTDSNQLAELHWLSPESPKLKIITQEHPGDKTTLISCASTDWEVTTNQNSNLSKICPTSPHQSGCLVHENVTGVYCSSGRLIVSGRHDGRSALWQVTADFPARPEPILLPLSNPALTVHASQFAGNEPLPITLSTMILPPQRFFLHYAQNHFSLQPTSPVVAPSTATPGYQTAYFSAPSSDGTAIPISVAWKNTSSPLSNRPLFLRGYGAYGKIIAPEFRPQDLVLMNHGGIVALIHTRGGGEKGAQWHSAGRGNLKYKSFEDFITGTRYLHQRGYGAPRTTISYGRSAGAQLVLASLGLAPELYAGVILEAPYVSRCRSDSVDGRGLSAQQETWDAAEWGTAAESAVWCQPAWAGLGKRTGRVFIIASEADERAPIEDTRTMVATLKRKSAAPVLLDVLPAATHSGPAYEYQRRIVAADIIRFTLLTAGTPGEEARQARLPKLLKIFR